MNKSKHHSANKEKLAEYRKKHYTGLYGSWYAMKQRCGNEKNQAYKNYGGRGIIYDKNWETFDGFKKDMEDGYKKGLTIERIDNNGNYCKENCKWETRKRQCNNTRKNTLIEFNGEKRTISEWSDLTGLKYHTILSRILRHWDINRIMNKNLERPCKIKT